MGIDVYVLKLLSYCREHFGPLGRTFQLGRQGIYLDPRHEPIADAIVQKHQIARTFRDVSLGQPYAEELFKALGATEIVSCDASPYEGASLIHDFNIPMPDDALEQFDTVFDGGSLEHIFNAPVALANLMRLTRVGGKIISVNGANNFLGHGFYQFSPDLAFRVFSAANGFKILGLYLVPLNNMPELISAADPTEVGDRIEIGQTPQSTYLMVVAEKVADVPPFQQWPQQSDYSVIWQSGANLA